MYFKYIDFAFLHADIHRRNINMTRRFFVLVLLFAIFGTNLSKSQEGPSRLETLKYIERIFRTCRNMEGVNRNGSHFELTPIGGLLNIFNIDEINSNGHQVYCVQNGCVEAGYHDNNGNFKHVGYSDGLPFDCGGREKRNFHRAIQYNFEKFGKQSSAPSFPETESSRNNEEE